MVSTKFCARAFTEVGSAFGFVMRSHPGITAASQERSYPKSGNIALLMKHRICLFMADFSGGGAERVMVNIANELAARGHEVDLVVARADGHHRELVGPGIQVRDVGRRLAYTLIPLVAYLRQNRPATVLAAGVHACTVAVLAKFLSGIPCRLVVSLHSELYPVPGALAGGWKERFNPILAKLFFRSADRIVTVSDGLRRRAMGQIGGPAEKYVTIYNPVFSERIADWAKEPIDHPWFGRADSPVLVGVGRLSREKGFDVLLHALALVRKRLDARLILLGEGPERDTLAAAADTLGIREAVDFHGFTRNPYAYVSRANMLVMPSRQESFGNVLVEALAVGTPVVSSDCPHGPREILGKGEYGTLVPPDNPEEMAQAILGALHSPQCASGAIERARCFSIERAVDLYEQVMGLGCESRLSAV
jgi:glycosyltransferase involved in cell wall biosynthesis